MKIYEEKYPMGTFKNQKTAGLYIHDMLYENLKILANAITKDNSFLLLISSQALSVRTGKSTFSQHLAEAWIHLLEKEHGTKLNLTMDNIAFNVDEFEKKAFALAESGQKYAPMILDESDDLTGHTLSKEVRGIMRFLRKAGQLNLLMIMILPDFFEFPKSIAVNRSIALITVDYGENFQRGYFKFFNFGRKKNLYIKGKQFNDYGVINPSFEGNFTSMYIVNEDEYRKEKYRDLYQEAIEEKRAKAMAEADAMKKKLYLRTYYALNDRITQKELCEIFEISDDTSMNWRKERENATLSANEVPNITVKGTMMVGEGGDPAIK